MFDFTQLSDTVTKAVDGAVKQLDVTKIDLTKLDLRTAELPKFEMPKFEMPVMEMPTFDFPKFEMPKFEMPEIDVPAEVERITDFMRDVTYAGIGVGVIAVQRVDAEVRKLVGTST